MGLKDPQAREDYRRVAAAIAYIDRHARKQPSLDEVADAVGLSPHHFHRLFRRWAGTTPKRFLQLLTLGDAKRRLEASRTVLRAAWDVGLSGPGRLHDLFVTLDGVTPGEFAADGEGVRVTWGLAPSPFGTALIGRTDRGVCHLSFLEQEARPGEPGARDPGAERRTRGRERPLDARLADLRDEWPRADLCRDDDTARSLAEAIFEGDRPALHVRGTNFQLQVWRALLAIPEGHVAAYSDVAEGLGRPEAARAVAGAVARNRVAWLIPCHRVIRKVGEAGGYRWGAERKRAMLAWESARSE
ncbi:MAG: methylated-DNA--[protein]-cysteine S-methyltransferase [Longimicrobiales bacterium]|nr:methylated-DNA--[protein]-cysteine S-methyltransferase [Longimicrobiales bacterium]